MEIVTGRWVNGKIVYSLFTDVVPITPAESDLQPVLARKGNGTPGHGEQFGGVEAPDTDENRKKIQKLLNQGRSRID